MPRPSSGPKSATPDESSHPPASLETVLEYIERINAHDAEGLSELASSDLRFVDARGEEFHLTSEGWGSYFEGVPDYHIDVDQILAADEFVAVFGSAKGTTKGPGTRGGRKEWEVPAAWKAVVRDGKLVEWHVFCDTQPMIPVAGPGPSA